MHVLLYYILSMLAETNIMVGTHADSLVAEAVLKGITGFDVDLAYAAAYKDATVPPVDAHRLCSSKRKNLLEKILQREIDGYLVICAGGCVIYCVYRVP